MLRSGLTDPTSVVADKEGDIFFTTGSNQGSVEELTSSGTHNVVLTWPASVIPRASPSTSGATSSWRTAQTGGSPCCPRPYTGAPNRRRQRPGFSPLGVAVDAAGDLFTATYGTYSAHEELYPYTGTPLNIPKSRLTRLNAIAIDPAGNLYLATCTPARARTYYKLAPPYTGTPTPSSSPVSTPISTGRRWPYSCVRGDSRQAGLRHLAPHQ